MQSRFQSWAPVAAHLAERFVLSGVYIYFAWLELGELRIVFGAAGADGGAEPIPVCRHAILLLLDLFIGLALLTGRKPAAAPRSPKELLVPLAASFYFVSYNILDNFYDKIPEGLRMNLAPERMRPGVAFAGLALATIGPAIALWGVSALGRSFGIFVSVREVVLRGPYRYVRHPMYAGYILIVAGLALTYMSLAAFVLVAGHLAVIAWRARLEEERLAEFSPEYREHMKRTNRFFPKLRLRL